jgi:hypothetical protein
MRLVLAFLSMLVLVMIVGAVLLIISYALALIQKPGRNRSGLGGALLQVHTLFKPSSQNIVEARKQRRNDDAQGKNDPPVFPP